MDIILEIILLELTILYGYLKFDFHLLFLQQSHYSVGRYLNYIKKNFFIAFKPYEILLVLIAFFLRSNLVLSFMLICIVMFFNFQFVMMSRKRFDTKLGLKYTPRVFRTLIIFFILIGTSILSFSYFTYLLIVLLMPLIMIITSLISYVIENLIKEYYKSKAKAKLESIKDIKVIGITGSYGKTSTKNIIFDLLSEFEPTLKTPKSFNTPNGVSMTINNELNPLFKNFIVEMGAFKKGDIKELTQFVTPSIGIVSSVGPQHLESFKHIDNVTKTKLELIEYMPKGSIAILNHDNDFIRDYNIQNKVKVLTFGIKNKDVNFYGSNIKFEHGITSFTFHDNKTKEKFKVETVLLGKHNVENIMASIICLKSLGFDIQEICKKTLKIKKIPNRLEFKQISKDTIIIDDSFNGNIEGIKEAVNLSKVYPEHKAILITPGIIDLGKEQYNVNKELGKYIAKYIDDLYIVSKENLRAIEDGFDNQANRYDNFLDAYNKAFATKGKKLIIICNDLPEKFN
ncbi:MAG: Mur ligase family protein [Mycoplasmatales bacterium]